MDLSLRESTEIPTNIYQIFITPLKMKTTLFEYSNIVNKLLILLKTIKELILNNGSIVKRQRKKVR
jgi:hypothetical protein